MLARAWQAGAGPGDAPLTIDLDSTICETYGLAKEGARHYGYTGARGYHPLLATATGEVLMSRLREGRANTARGAAHFLRETVGWVRYGGARGQLTVRADSGFYAHTVVSACREVDVRFSITIRQHASLRGLIEAIPEDVKGVDKTCHWGVEVQGKCPVKCSAKMSLSQAWMVSDDGVAATTARVCRVGGPSASVYFFMVALWIPNSRSIARSDIPLRLAF